MNLITILTAYVFSFFVGQSDGLHLAYSRDGYNWTPVADNRSLLVPVIGNDRLMRDPSICQGPNGTYHMVWTSSWTDRIIGYSSSKDLIHWSEQKAIPVMMHEPEAHNCWAPELFYDKPSKTFYIFWATTIPGRHKEIPVIESEKGLNHRIYYTTTKDFETFAPTKIYFNPDFSAIDAAVVKDPSNGELIMFVKNENSLPAEKNIRITRSKKMSKGFPTKVSEPIHGNFWAEGPSPLFLEDGTLICYYDKYRDHQYGASVSKDHGKTWTDLPASAFSLPAGMRHGTAFRVDDSVVDALEALAVAPKPIYRDPIYDGAADPIICRNRETGVYHMFYTNRRANIKTSDGVSWVHGSPIGIATSTDLAHWSYLQDANIDYKPDAEPTYWAPSVIDDGKLYHMFLTYVPGVFTDWNHPRNIVHLTSKNLLDWKYIDTPKLASNKVIDADVVKLPSGKWGMWYNQELGGKRIAYAESDDLYNWTDYDVLPTIVRSEGPKVFFWKGSWWMFTDEWKGFGVYRSDDTKTWTRQEGNLLGVPGKGVDDGVMGNHCEVLVHGEHAYIYYFTHPDRAAQGFGRPGQGRPARPAGYNPNRSLIQVAELKCEDGKTITCDRDELCIIQ